MGEDDIKEGWYLAFTGVHNQPISFFDGEWWGIALDRPLRNDEFTLISYLNDEEIIKLAVAITSRPKKENIHE